MQILWISQNVPFPPKTGVLQRNYNLVREASRIGDVTLLAVLKEDILPGGFDLDEAKRELGLLCKKVEVVEIPIESSRLLLYWTALKSLFTSDPFTVNWIKSGRLRDKIAELTRETKFDVIHYDTISLAAYADLAGDTAKVLNHHNIESHLFQRRALIEKHPLKRLYYNIEGKKLQRYEAGICPTFDVNFTVSELDADRLVKIAPGTRTRVIANGVDVDYFSPLTSVAEEPESVIMVSGMNWFPNRDAAIYMCDKIWPLLSRKFPNITWTVVGSSPPEKLLQLAASDSHITVTGFVDDVRDYIAKAQVYLCPMRDGGGTRLKILDALAMGKPIVGTTMAYEGISVTPERNVLVADTPEAFVEQIGRLVNDSNLRRQIGEAARKFVIDNYSWPVIGDQLRDCYRDIIARRS